MAAMIFEGARVVEERKQKPFRPRQGTSLQALAHLGLEAFVDVSTEADPCKRKLLGILHGCLQCRVKHNLTTVFPGGS